MTRTQRFAIELTSPEAFTRSPGLRSRRMVFVAVVFAVGALAGTLLNIHYDRLFLTAKKTLSQRKELAALPRDLGLYRLEESLALEEDEREMLAPTEEHLAAYRGPDGRLFTLTLLYWEPPYGRPSERPDLLRRPHTPDECYPAAGWTRVPGYTQDRQFDIFPGEFGSIRVYRRKDEVQIMAFWLGLAFKRTLAPDQLLSRLTSMVRSLSYAPAANIHTVTITTRGTGDTEGDVQAVLDFAATLYSILPDYGVGMRQPDQP